MQVGGGWGGGVIENRAKDPQKTYKSNEKHTNIANE